MSGLSGRVAPQTRGQGSRPEAGRRALDSVRKSRTSMVKPDRVQVPYRDSAPGAEVAWTRGWCAIAGADPVADGDPLSSPAGSESATAAAALRAADVATRMGGRRHRVLGAAVLSGFVVRAVELAAEIDRGRLGNADRLLIRALARDLSRGLDRARTCTPGRQLGLDTIIMPGFVLAFTLGQAGEPSPDRDYRTALRFARGLAHVIGERILDPGLDLLLLSRDHDLELARELAEGLGADLTQAIGPAAGPMASVTTRERISRALDLAGKRSRALDRVCLQAAADRLGIVPAQGLAEALLDGAMDDFTSADLTGADLAGTDLTGVRWSLSGTAWPPGTNVKKLLGRSEQAGPGGVLVITRRGMGWPP